MNIGTTIRRLRKSKKIRQQQLAKDSGISQSYLSQIEKNEKNPSLETLENVSLAQKVPFPIISFLSLEESKVPKEKILLYREFSPVINQIISKIFNI